MIAQALAVGRSAPSRYAAALIRLDGYLVQRRCPHLKADLARFGDVEDGVLTCRMHGWQFDLATGRCLTSDDRRLHSVPASDAGQAEQTAQRSR